MKINKKYIIIFGLVVFAFLIFLFLILKSNKPEEIIELKNVTFTTSDNRVTITAKEDFKKRDVSNYDLYLTKNDKQIVGLFTYNLNEYEEKNVICYGRYDGGFINVAWFSGNFCRGAVYGKNRLCWRCNNRSVRRGIQGGF